MVRADRLRQIFYTEGGKYGREEGWRRCRGEGGREWSHPPAWGKTGIREGNGVGGTLGDTNTKQVDTHTHTT